MHGGGREILGVEGGDMNEAVRAVLLDLEDRYGDHHYPDAARIIREMEAERDALRARCERMEGLIVEACYDPLNWVSTAWHSKASAALKEAKP